MRIIALEYHDVIQPGRWDESGFPGPAAATYELPIDAFEAHLDAIGREGPVILSDVAAATAHRSPGTPVVLTFDDGGSGYAHAADLLEARGWRGHLFMTTGCIDKPGFLQGSELRDLQARGHTIGTHSRSHPVRMSALPGADISEEWRTSLSDLRNVLGQDVHIGSVPGGHHSRAVAEAAALNGITTLFTSEPEAGIQTVAGCTVVGRFTLRSGHPASYAARLVGRAPFARGLQWLEWNAKKVAKAVGGEHYLRVRERVIGS